MKKALAILVVTALVFTATSAFAQEDRELKIIGDLVIVRPFSIAMVPVGLVIYAVSLPFALLGGNEEKTREVLVGHPVRFAFTRGLGEFDTMSRGY